MSAKDEENEKDDHLAGVQFTLEKDGTQKCIRLVRLIFWSQGVMGRGTIVAEAVCMCGSSGCECECDWAGPLVVKISFPATDGAMEYELVSEALNKAVDEHTWARNHLPRILWAQNVPSDEDTPQGQLAKLFPDHYEKRHACVTVQRKLQPIHDLVTPEEFTQVFYDILQCHRWLYVIPEILHRDISMNNIMFWRNPTTREVYGVLNDFDLSSRVAEDRKASSKQRIGTIPLMAYDLFHPKRVLGHLYRHDLESIFYVLLCLCAHYKGPGKHMDISKDKSLPYESWFTQSYDQVRGSKLGLILHPSNLITDSITDFFRKFEAWVVGIHDSLKEGYLCRGMAEVKRSSFDQETFGGLFTYASVSAAMSHFDGAQLKTRTIVSLD
ncbi:hypothetical protein L218DRAFT_112759 [Marasmius fiardii PR-910]|nr:hypothetical protein L218DRAFT_112759 [Marasmius fiardii PR-910]